MVRIPEGGKMLRINLLVLIKYTNVSYRQTDGRTESQPSRHQAALMHRVNEIQANCVAYRGLTDHVNVTHRSNQQPATSAEICLHFAAADNLTSGNSNVDPVARLRGRRGAWRWHGFPSKYDNSEQHDRYHFGVIGLSKIYTVSQKTRQLWQAVVSTRMD